MTAESEIIETLQAAAKTIRDLRESNRLLAAKMAVVELFERVFLAPPPPPNMGQAQGVDIAWKLEQMAAGMTAAPLKKAAKEAKAAPEDDHYYDGQDQIG